MLKTMLEQFHELEKETIQALSQLEELRRKIQEASGMEEMNDMDVAQIPFAAYEMQLERNLEEKKEIEERHLQEKESIHKRHEEEKDKMRKHYKGIILWISIPFIAFIIATFGTVAWFFSNYEIASYSQDSTYGNANFVGNDGDIENGEANYYPWQTEEPGN